MSIIVIFESLFAVQKCPGNLTQKIILSVFWFIKICISLYVRYDAHEHSRSDFIDRIDQDNYVVDKIQTAWKHLRSGLYSHRIGNLYSNSSKFKKFIVARRHLWALLSDIGHLVFIHLTMGEKKTMPIGSLVAYCSLIILDSVFTFIITKKFMRLFESKMGLIVSTLLLKFIFGPIESLLELQYFGREVEGYEKRYAVGLGISMAVFDLMREVVDVRIDFRLIKNFDGSEHNIEFNSTSRKIWNCLKNAGESKLREVITVVNLTGFYLEVFKLLIYSLSLIKSSYKESISGFSDDFYDDWTHESNEELVPTTQMFLIDEELVSTTQSTNHTKSVCEDISSVSDSFKTLIDEHHYLNVGIIHPRVILYVSVLVYMHYILVGFLLIIGKTFSMKQLMLSLFNLPVCIKRIFLLSFHMTIPNVCTFLFIAGADNLDSSSFVVGTFIQLYIISALVALYSVVWFVHALHYTILYFSCFSAPISVHKFSSYSGSIIELIKNTNSGSSVVEHDSCHGGCSAMFYRRTITVMAFIIYLLFLVSNMFVFSINFHVDLPLLLSPASIDSLKFFFNFLDFTYVSKWTGVSFLTITQSVSAACGCLILCSILLSLLINKTCPSKRTPLHMLLCKSPKKNFNLCFVLPITPMGESVESGTLEIDTLEIIVPPEVFITTNGSCA